MLQSYEDLEVWKKSIAFVKQIYSVTDSLPNEEKFGLVSQMRRASISIPSNIAEGYKRHSTKEYIHFLSVAEGSAAELETQLIITSQLFSDLEIDNLLEDLDVIQRMLYSLKSSLELKNH